MQLSAAISGRLEEILEKELKNAELAVTKGVSSATSQFKEAMRKQVKSAKLGSRLAYTWRGDVYPKSKMSLNAAGMVYSKAEKIMQSFEYGLVVRGKDGFWLAIPTPAIPKKYADVKLLLNFMSVQKVFAYVLFIVHTELLCWYTNTNARQ